MFAFSSRSSPRMIFPGSNIKLIQSVFIEQLLTPGSIVRLQGSRKRYNSLCSLNSQIPWQNSLGVPKYKVMIKNHTSRYTTADGFTWEEGGSNCNVYTRALRFREKGKCEAGWPSLAPPLSDSETSPSSLSLWLLWQSTSGKRGLKMFPPTPRPHTHTESHTHGAYF